jgi:hypothetical protein
VQSTDRFLTSLARIQVEIKDERKVPVLKFWVRRSPSPWAEESLGKLAQVWLAAGYGAEGHAERSGDVGEVTAAAKGSEQTRNVPLNQQIASSHLYEGYHSRWEMLRTTRNP